MICEEKRHFRNNHIPKQKDKKQKKKQKICSLVKYGNAKQRVNEI